MNYNEELNNLYKDIKTLVISSKQKIYQTVNTEMLNLYWLIGKKIIEIQGNKERADYGKRIIQDLSVKLTSEFGKGFSYANLKKMRQFYVNFPISSSLSSQLSWSHYIELIKIDDDKKRNFYMHECINSNWSVRELQRQKNSLLYERLIMSKDKKEILKLSRKNQEIKITVK